MKNFFEKGRLEAMSDGVYAILMTLLVLNLDVSKIANQVTQIGLKDALWHLLPEFWGFVLAFMLIAVFWTTHYKQYRHVKEVNEGLLWINILGLLFTTLIPFSTSMTTEYSDKIADLFFASNILIVGLINVLQWYYIGAAKLLDEKIDDKYWRRILYRNFILPVVTVLVMIFSFVVGDWSMLGFMTIPVAISVLFRKRMKKK